MFDRSSIKSLVFFTAFAFTLLNCAVVKAEETKTTYVRAVIHWHEQYEEIISTLGEIWIGYTSANINIVAQGGTGRFIIEKANFYYKGDGDNFILIGSLDETGVHDKDGNLLREIPRNLSNQMLGISSSLVEEGNFTVRLILYSDRFGAFESEIWEYLDIDIKNATISLMDRSGFWGP